jgi:hypothetical protein
MGMNRLVGFVDGARRTLGLERGKWPSVVRDIHRLLLSVDWANETERDLDQLERLAAAVQAACRVEMWKRIGFVEREWRPTTPNSPARRKHEDWGTWDFDYDLTHGWFDHAYRLTRKEDGVTLFCSEPYRLEGDGLRNLVKLMDQGWSVSVGAEYAIWFAGHTLLVQIRKRESEVS